MSWYFLNYPGIITGVHYFFDRSEPFEGDFKELWNRETSRVIDATSEKEVWSLIQTVSSADMRSKPSLQAADLLAWSSNRHLAGEEGDFGYYYDHFMKVSSPSSTVVFDEQKLREAYGSMHS